MESNENVQVEKTFYQDENVYVSQSRLVVGGKTYAMRNISSVTIYQNQKKNYGSFILILFGIFLAIIGAPNGKILGVIIIGFGIAIIYFSGTKVDFSVQISSNSGESKALVSEDMEYIQKIVDSVNEAIIYRG